MGLLDLIGRKRARDKPQNSYEGQDFSYLFGRTTSGENVDEFKAMQTTQSMPVCVFLLKRWRHFLFTSMNGQKMGRRKSWTTHCTFFFMMNPIQRCPPLSFERQS